jgi:hypothetical protein
VTQSFPMKRLAPGIYESQDSRWQIHRVLSIQTRHATEICWKIFDNGVAKTMCEDSLKDAKDTILNILKKEKQ